MRGLFGGILLAIGILIAGLSGLCSLIVVFGSLANGQAVDALGMALVFGGIPLAIGVGLIFAGRALIASGKNVAEPTQFHSSQFDRQARAAHPLNKDDEAGPDDRP